VGPKQTHPEQLSLCLCALPPPPIPEAIRPQVVKLLATLLQQAADVEPEPVIPQPGGSHAS
jgi:hypothetical protein